MASVGVIYAVRKAFSPAMLKLYVLAAATVAIWRLVWVTRVEQNFLNVTNGGVVAVGNYVLYAVVHTHLAVQITLAIAAVAFVGLIIDAVRAGATPRRMMAY